MAGFISGQPPYIYGSGFFSCVRKDLLCLQFPWVRLVCDSDVNGQGSGEMWPWGVFAPCKDESTELGADFPPQAAFCPGARHADLQ